MLTRRYWIIPTLYPIFFCACFFMGGIWLSWCTVPIAYLVIIGGCPIILGLIPIPKPTAFRPFYMTFYCVFCIAGFLLYQKTIDTQKYMQSYTYNKTFALIGAVEEIQKTTNPHLRYTFIVRIEKLTNIANKETENSPSVRILIQSPHRYNVQIADHIRIQEVIFRPCKNQDFLRYLLKKNCACSITINCPIDIVSRPTFSISRMIDQYKHRILSELRSCMDHKTYLAFASIFCGEPLAKKKENQLKNQLKMWGLFHYIARAGLHLVIFVSIWMFLIGFLPIPWSIRQLAMLLICTIYGLLTWPSLPFNRAFFTLLCTKTCGLFRIQTYLIPCLSLVAIATLFSSPSTLFALDFQLSFGVTFALAWLNEMRALSKTH